MWTAQQRYCTACAAAALLGFVLLAIYIDPAGLARLNPFGGENCSSYEQQRTFSKQQQPHERLPSGERRETGTEHDARNTGTTAPEQQRSQGDYYSCRLAIYTRQLALFTGALVVATVILIGTGIYQGVHLGRAANAAKASADVLPATERPYVLMSGGGGLAINAGLTQIPRQAVFYRIGNYGKTPAVIENFRVGFSINTYRKPDVPSRVEETHIVLSARIIVPGDENKLLFAFVPTEWTTRDWQPPRGPITGVLQEIAMVDNEDAFFWLIVNYRGTFTVGHETSVCWKYNKAERLFLTYEGDEYNYER